MNRVASNPVPIAAAIDGNRLGEQPDAALGGIVGGTGATDHSHDGRNVDNGTTTGCLHGPDGRLTANKHRIKVDVHDLLPLLKGHIFHGSRPATGDAGVVDQNIQPAEGCLRLRNDFLPTTSLCHLLFQCDGLTASLTNHIRRLFRRFQVHVSHNNLRAFLC